MCTHSYACKCHEDNEARPRPGYKRRRHFQVRNSLETESQEFLLTGVSFPQGKKTLGVEKKVLIIGPGTSRGRLPLPRRRPGWKENFSKRPFLPAPFLFPTRYSAPHSEAGPLAQPPVSGACAPGPGPRGGLLPPFFPSLPSFPPAAKPRRVPGLRREARTHLVGVTCCPGPARESPPGPGARRGPQPGQAALAPHPRPAPAAGLEGGTGFSQGSFR